MADKTADKEKGATGPAAKKRSGRGVRLTAGRVKKMIAKLMESLENEESNSKASVGELLKLLQVYKELTAEQIKEVEVRWVDRLHTDESPGK